LDETYTLQPWVKNAVEEAATNEYYEEDFPALAEIEGEDAKTTLSQGPK